MGGSTPEPVGAQDRDQDKDKSKSKSGGVAKPRSRPLDAIFSPSQEQDQLPRPAIRPYPTEYVRPGRMKNGEEILFRPIRPEDEPAMIKFHEALSDRTVYFRYFQSLKLSQRTAHERLARICFIDYDHEMALVAEHKDANGDPAIIAIGRLSQLRDRHEGEMAVLVEDRFQHQGLGTELYRRLIEVARAENLSRVESIILADNRDMQAICRKLGFRLKADLKDGTVQAVLKLQISVSQLTL